MVNCYQLKGYRGQRITPYLIANAIDIECFKQGMYVIEDISQDNSMLYPSLMHYPNMTIRYIDSNLQLADKRARFNQLVLGASLSKSMLWYRLLSIKMKYLFSNQLRRELLQLFDHVEYQFYQRNHQQVSLVNRILISWMRVLASWDKDVSLLVVDDCFACLDTKVSSLFLQCLNELSNRVAVVMIGFNKVSTNRLVKVNLNLIN